MRVRDEIIVNDMNIRYAEQIMLPADYTFDKERREFLSDFTTLDLKAVPGSGKTTLLLAKLIILEQNLPLRSKRSILVLSHTNTAVNEIELKLKNSCPTMFSYPNHIGTIQSFVNKFLAIPYFESTMGIKVNSIDDEYYNRLIEMKYEFMPKSKLKSWLENQHDPVGLLKKIRFNDECKLVYYINGSPDGFPLKDVNSAAYRGLVRFKMKIMNMGILHYDDAYFLANRYIMSCPQIENIIKRRFAYVFVDEMQDMDVHQFKVLEMFNDEDVCFQRLGDNNQAIYNNIVHSNNLWSTREQLRTLKGSYRLTPTNANLVSKFGVDNIEIKGLNDNNHSFKPVIIIYGDGNIECEVIKMFSKYVEELIATETNNAFEVSNYKVISWRKEHKEGRIALQRYCPRYESMIEDSKTKNQYTITNSKLIKKIYDSIGEICFKLEIKIKDEILTKNNIKNILHMSLDNKSKLEKYLYDLVRSKLLNNSDEFQSLYLSLLNYVFQILKVNGVDVTQIWNSQIEKMDFFCWTSEATTERCSECCINGCSPVMGSVHSVKGETHNVTLFLESFYDNKYESDILHEAILGSETTANLISKELGCIYQLGVEIDEIKLTGKTYGIKRRAKDIISHKRKISKIQQYSKLVYVALSRATGIVGFAINRERFGKYFEGKLKTEDWEILVCDE